MKRLLIAAVVLLAATGVRAQDFRWGPAGAVNFAWEKGRETSSDCYMGFYAGVKAEVDFSDIITSGFYVDGRLLYSLKGGDWAGFHHNLGYLEIPVNLGYRYAIDRNVALMGSLGPYFGFGILGRKVTSSDGAKIKSDLFGEQYKRFDFGLNYNAGVELWKTWQFYLGFEHSFLNICKSVYGNTGDGVRLRPFNFYVGTAYMF